MDARWLGKGRWLSPFFPTLCSSPSAAHATSPHDPKAGYLLLDIPYNFHGLAPPPRPPPPSPTRSCLADITALSADNSLDKAQGQKYIC